MVNTDDAADRAEGSEFRPASIAQDATYFGCGLLMGAADTVPGVSGGTVALIIGIYERLVAAIRRADAGFVRLVISGEFRLAAARINLRFLISLAFGILVAVGGLASVITFLLKDHRTVTFAGFSGMILVSSLLVGRQIPVWDQMRIGTLLLSVVLACWLVNRPALQHPPDSHWYLFVCGTIGITAMILPGISGAFIVLLLGRYETVLGALKNVLHFNLSAQDLGTCAVFGAGCVCGLAVFSRVLHWLLTRHHDTTMAVLCGFMLGSLYRIWPFQRDLTPQIEEMKHKTLENFLPRELSGEVWSAAFVFVICSGVVVALDGVAGRVRMARRLKGNAAVTERPEIPLSESRDAR